MRRVDDYPIDPDVASQLDAIDATLAGEPVASEHAELAELALLLAAQRPKIDPGFSRSLDDRVGRRFAADAGAPRARPRWRWSLAGGVATAIVAAIVAVVVVSSVGSSQLGSGSSSGASTPASLRASPSGAAGRSARASAAGSANTPTVTASSSQAAGGPTAPGSGTASSPAAAPPVASGAASAASGAALQPPANGRKIVQSAQIALTAVPTRIDDVAQQVFDVVGAEKGIVNRSTVTATGGPDGYAQFELSVPSASLPDTMARLSRLRNAHVASRTDTTQDVNNQFVAATRRLADDTALRTSLLKQLASAATQQQIDSLNAQIHDTEAAIAGDQAAIRTLNRQIDFSQISLTINAGVVPVAHSSGFTIGKGAHDAARVLTVAAGVALIVLAALVPVTLLVALSWWIAAAARRRRREQALDLA